MRETETTVLFEPPYCWLSYLKPLIQSEMNEYGRQRTKNTWAEEEHVQDTKCERSQKGLGKYLTGYF